MKKQKEITKYARQLILKMGYESFRLDDLLSEMKLSKGGFYHYFKSVEALLEALIIEDFESDMEHIDNACKKDSVKQSIIDIFKVGSTHHESESGILSALKTEKSLKLYLALMEAAWYIPFKEKLSKLLERGISTNELPHLDVFFVCELFDAINHHANRSEILGLWTEENSYQFYKNVLNLLSEQLGMKTEFRELIKGM